MKRWVLIAAAAAAVALAASGLRRVSQRPAPVPASRPGAVARQIVVLRDNSTLFEPNGTVGRTLADWLAAGTPGSRTFEFGGHQFVGRSPDATPEAKARLTNLMAMLRAYPEVTARIIGYTDPTADSIADKSLAETRACRVLQILTTAGIASSRLSCEGKGGVDPVGKADTAAGHAANHRIAITFTIPSNSV